MPDLYRLNRLCKHDCLHGLSLVRTIGVLRFGYPLLNIGMSTGSGSICPFHDEHRVYVKLESPAGFGEYAVECLLGVGLHLDPGVRFLSKGVGAGIARLGVPFI